MTAAMVAPNELRNVIGLAGDELAWGWPFGKLEDPRKSPASLNHRPHEHPRAVLESLVLKALQAGPTYVSFSGGRDSSALLALTVHVARKHGLDTPIPLTSRYGNDPDADETDWQELVVRHLNLQEWLILDATDTADALSSWSTEVVRAVGHNVFPPAAARAGARVTHARGGTLIGGEPGDWVLGPHRATALHYVIRHRGMVSGRAWRAAVEAVAPAYIRGELRRRRMSVPSWLKPGLASESRRRAAQEVKLDPLRWDAALMTLPRTRFSAIGFASVNAIWKAYGVQPLSPFASIDFLAAYSAWGGRLGLPGRTAAMRALFGDVLPEPVLRRTSKATFNRQLFGPSVRAFAKDWNGAGVDDTRVDADRLRMEWLAERPDSRSLSLLQEAWLAQHTSADGHVA